MFVVVLSGEFTILCYQSCLQLTNFYQVLNNKLGLNAFTFTTQYLVMKSILFFLLCSASMVSQNFLSGKVVLETPTLEKIYILNFSAKKETVADNQGFFKIAAQPYDTLVVSGVNIKGIQIVLKPTDFSADLFFVKLKSQPYVLDEVVVQNFPRINAVDLGIVSGKTKKYTPAERRLKVASESSVLGNTDGTTGGSIGIDPLFNAISGRTAMLEKIVEVEKKEKLQGRLQQMFSEEFYTKVLRLPLEYIKGFTIYALDDKDIVALLNTKKTKLVENLLKEKVMNYLEIINAKE